MYLRTFLLLVVVRLVWMKVVDDSEPSLQYLDPSSLVTSLDVIESNINTLNEELNDITSKMKEHTLEAMADTTTETTEVIDEAIGNNEKVNQLLEHSEEKMDEKIEDILDMSETTKEAKQIPEMTVTPQIIVNNKKIINLTELTGEQTEEKKDNTVNMTSVKNEKLSSKAVTEKIENNEKAINLNELLNKKEEIMESSKVNDEDGPTSKEITEIIDAIDMTIEEKMEKKSDDTENNEKAINLNELLNKKEEIMESSKVNDEDGLTSKEITETIDAIGMTIEEKMEKKPVEFFQDFFDEDNEDFEENIQLQSEVDDPSTILDTIISEEMSSTVHLPERNDEMEEDTKDKINFLEESMNKPENTLNLHLVDLERIEDVHEQIGSEIKAEDGTINENSIEMASGVETFDDVVKQSSVLVDLGRIEDVHEQIESESKAEDGTINENSIEMPLGVETFGDESSGKFKERQSQEIKQFWNPIKVNDYKEENNVVDQKYSSRPKEGVDLWFPIHIDIEDLDHVEDSAQITQIENGEKAQDDIPKEKPADELTQTPDDELVYKETKFNPNVKLLLKRTGFLKDNEAVLAHKDEERSSWMIVVVGLPMMLLVLLLAVLMGIIILHKTDKKPMIFMKSLNLWGNDYDRMEISSIKKPKYNKIK